MKIKTFSLILLILAIMLPFSANADQLYLNGVNGNVDLTGGAYISPYFGGLNDPNGLQNINCVDPQHDSYLGTNWTVNVTLLDNNTSLTNTFLQDPTKYKEMAYLLFYTGFSSQLPSVQAQIQAAIWFIANNSSGFGQNNSWVTLAANNYGNGNYSQVLILTDTGQGTYYTQTGYNAGSWTNQEFMTKVPEPSVILLLGSGLVGLWGFRRRFRN